MKKITLKAMILALVALVAFNTQGQDVVDLTGITTETILADTLPDVPAGAIVLLEPGMTYQAGSYAFDKALTLQSAQPNSLDMPKIDCDDNFNFADGATVDSVIFRGIEFFGDFDGHYVLNSNVAATIGKFCFDGCKMRSLRGILRMKDNGPGTMEDYMIMNCVIDSIRDYGIITVDRDDWMCNNISITNTTISRARGFLTSRNNSNSLLIDGCTINEAPAAGMRCFRWRTSEQNNVLNGIMIKNTVWGPGWDEENSGSTGYDGFDGLGETTWTLENVFTTSDIVYAEDKDSIPGFEDVAMGVTAAEFWKDPSMCNFNYMDDTFVGIGNAGDPRWGISTDAGGVVWNISHPAFNALGEMVMSKKVAGMMIYATSDKKITIDENGKELDEMVFTHRLKFGGGGSFDDDGQPVKRVLSFDVKGTSTITVIGMSSSSSSDRVLNIAAGHEDNLIAEFPALGSPISKGVYTYTGGPSKIYMYSPSSGVNLYYIKIDPGITSINEIELPKDIVNMYPNPASDRVFFDVTRPVEVGVYNIAGSLVKSKLIESQSDFIDVSHLQRGIYFVRSMKESLFVKKLIVK